MSYLFQDGEHLGFRMLQDIDAEQPRLSEFVTPANQKWLYDLIYKGILYLSDEPIHSSQSQPPENRITASSGMIIAELQSKTTPTCLSSYLPG